jgi:hypothetical protein
MAVDIDVVADTPILESEEQADDFKPLGGDENFVALAADEDKDEDEDPSCDKTFHPHRITLPTFRRLLACYSTTAEQVYRRKMMVKLQPKPAKGSLPKLKKRAGSASATATGAALIQKTDFNASEQRYIQTETDKYLELDQLRYEGLPKKVAERKTGDEGNEKNGYLSKDELLSIMEWKMYVDISSLSVLLSNHSPGNTAWHVPLSWECSKPTRPTSCGNPLPQRFPHSLPQTPRSTQTRHSRDLVWTHSLSHCAALAPPQHH